MEKIEIGYYWILVCHYSDWQIAYFIGDGNFKLIGESQVYNWEDIRQIGEVIPPNTFLYNMKHSNK